MNDETPATKEDFDSLLAEIRTLNRTVSAVVSAAVSDRQGGTNSVQLVMPPPGADERSAQRTEKYFTAMVVLNLCMGAMLVANWITDTNQSHVINAIYMMAPGLQEQIEAKKEKQP